MSYRAQVTALLESHGWVKEVKPDLGFIDDGPTQCKERHEKYFKNGTGTFITVRSDASKMVHPDGGANFGMNFTFKYEDGESRFQAFSQRVADLTREATK